MDKEELNVYTNLFEYPTKTIVRLENENEKLEKENKELKAKIKYYENPINYFKYASKNVVDENKELKETLNEIYKINNQAKKDLEEIDSNPLKDDIAFRSYLQTIISLIEIKLKGGDSDE